MKMSWEIDPVHSEATFSVRHAMVTTVRGQFKVLGGKLEIDDEHPENSSVEAQVETASIDTRDAGRDGHLRSPDFFNADQYPLITFKSTKVEPLGGENYRVLGILDLHGVQKEVAFDAEYAGRGKDPWGNTRAGLSAKTTVNRKDFGLVWNVALEAGGVLVSEHVKIEIDLSIVDKG
jgi:polyisoprenoid-binding protein YceI